MKWRNRVWIIVLVVLALIVVQAAPIVTFAQEGTFVLPEPTGEYQIGTATYYWIDESREETLTNDPNDLRELMVRIWYPAEVGTDMIPEYYIPNGEVIWEYLWRGLIGQVDISPALEEVVQEESHAFSEAPVSSEDASYPVVIFSHGYSAIPEIYSLQLEELASHGYVVVGITHPYAAAVTLFPDGRIAPPDGRLLAGGNDLVAVEDVIFVLNQLETLNVADQKGMFAGRLNLEQTGVFGHSWGGVFAAHAARLDSRFKAGIVVDGPISRDLSEQGFDQPFMFMEAQFPLLYTFQNTTVTAYYLQVDGFTHMSYSDVVLWPDVSLKHPSDVDAVRSVEITNAYILAFFDEYLKGVEQPLLDGPSDEYPEVEIQSRNTE